ncbi:MAG: glutamine amidotransferase, partial [Alphaproteobacteria bacterium]|nr:glutamine amidotransferase [Alphaproteobacteria bacterium]
KKPVMMLTHVTALDAGQIAVIAAGLGHPVEVLRLNKGAVLPDNIEDYAGFVSFGGPASANDEHIDYIRAELDWMPRVIALGVPLLGVCLGAQLVARSLGAAVALHAEGLYEFGYYPVTPLGDGDDLQMDGPLEVCHRHGEGFELPAGATHLARRESFPNQAFRYGATSFAVQFHPEVNDAVIDAWLNRDPPPEDLARRGAQSADEQFRHHASHQQAMHAWLEKFLIHWLAQGG